MKVNKNSPQPNKVHNQEVVTQNEPQQENMTKSKSQTKNRANRKNWIPFSSEKKAWSNFIQKALLLLVAQNDLISPKQNVNG